MGLRSEVVLEGTAGSVAVGGGDVEGVVGAEGEVTLPVGDEVVVAGRDVDLGRLAPAVVPVEEVDVVDSVLTVQLDRDSVAGGLGRVGGDLDGGDPRPAGHSGPVLRMTQRTVSQADVVSEVLQLELLEVERVDGGLVVMMDSNLTTLLL